MKKNMFISLILILIICTGCIQTERDEISEEKIEQTSVPSVEIQPTVTPSFAPKLTENAMPNPMPTLNLIEPIIAKEGEYIPDIMVDSAETANSNYALYEDEKYIYYRSATWSSDNLYLINKSNGKIKKILYDCDSFTVSNGVVYYIKWSSDDTNEIFKYYVETDTKKSIITMENQIWNIVCLKDKLYFGCDVEFHAEDRPFLLYACDLNGENLIKIGEGVDDICLYNDRIFGIGLAEIGPLIEFYDGTNT